MIMTYDIITDFWVRRYRSMEFPRRYRCAVISRWIICRASNKESSCRRVRGRRGRQTWLISWPTQTMKRTRGNWPTTATQQLCRTTASRPCRRSYRPTCRNQCWISQLTRCSGGAWPVPRTLYSAGIDMMRRATSDCTVASGSPHHVNPGH